MTLRSFHAGCGSFAGRFSWLPNQETWARHVYFRYQLKAVAKETALFPRRMICRRPDYLQPVLGSVSGSNPFDQVKYCLFRRCRTPRRQDAETGKQCNQIEISHNQLFFESKNSGSVNKPLSIKYQKFAFMSQNKPFLPLQTASCPYSGYIRNVSAPYQLHTSSMQKYLCTEKTRRAYGADTFQKKNG